VSLGEGVEVAEQPIEEAHHLGGGEALRAGGEIDDIGEQHRGGREMVGDGAALALEALATVAGSMFNGRLSDRCCSARRAASASSRCLANRAIRVKKIVPPTVTLRASSMPENHSGKREGIPRAMPTTPEAREIVTKGSSQPSALIPDTRDEENHELP
jgi:hypothetical protein